MGKGAPRVHWYHEIYAEQLENHLCVQQNDAVAAHSQVNADRFVAACALGGRKHSLVPCAET